jgi:hypothetical protein
MDLKLNDTTMSSPSSQNNSAKWRGALGRQLGRNLPRRREEPSAQGYESVGHFVWPRCWI